MKKIFIIGLLAVLFAGCSFKTTVDGSIGIPRHVAYIEFWNGGTMIHQAEYAQVVTKIDTNTKAVGAGISFYRYEVTGRDSVTWVIVDSEALSMRYREQ